MTRFRTAQILTWVSALGFFVEAARHAAQYRPVVFHASQGFSSLIPLVATLWLAFAAALVVLGLIVTLVAVGRAGGAKWLLALAGCFPLVTAILQLHFLGVTRATAVLALLAAISFAAAIVFPKPALPARDAHLERGLGT